MLALYGVAVTIYYYASAVDNYFIWDDYWFLMTSGGDAKTVLFGAPALRIVGNVIFWVNYLMYGLNHTGYTVTSIVIHLANVFLVYHLLKLSTQDQKFSFVSSAVFASMSVYCDAVISKGSLLTATNLTFYCTVLITYLIGRERKKYYYISLAVFFLGMFNKEEIASVPLLILFLEVVLYDNVGGIRKAFGKIVPHIIIIIGYIATSIILTRTGLMYQEQFDRLAKFRPLHSLLGGYASFVARPDGFLLNRFTLVGSIVLALVLPLALYVSRNRNLLLFGLGWVFLTFLPQSYSNLTQYAPKYLFSSISRHLYTPSVGAAIVIASVVLFSSKPERRYLVNALAAGLLIALITYNAPLVHARSSAWGESPDAQGMKLFLLALKARVPSFEKGAHLVVDIPPTGRAYMFRALRAFYQNDVVYVDDPSKLDVRTVPSLYYIENRTDYGQGVAVWRVK